MVSTVSVLSAERRTHKQKLQLDATLRHLAEAALQDEDSWARLVHAEEEALAQVLPPGLPTPLRPKSSTPPEEPAESSDAHCDAVAMQPSAATAAGQSPAKVLPPPPRPTAQPVPTVKPPPAKLDLADLFGDRGRTSRAESRVQVDDLFSGQAANGLLLGSSSSRGTPAGKRGSLFGDDDVHDDPLFSSLPVQKS
eukprot:CAMPEP_0119088002 /NCGR_PEP_ID=MMETSP1178-20130426/143889_1 /TAXON_ID=33656 /ORGANISM="unid sp, Strain CCMP2000" /LENGTH=194 /DNA_ID=CAMNT_0007071253 /DNA_START=23 /DNA_END=607 /DNA_ORIENTATION=+